LCNAANQTEFQIVPSGCLEFEPVLLPLNVQYRAGLAHVVLNSPRDVGLRRSGKVKIGEEAGVNGCE
jgi:hypothetical protein